MDQIPLVERRLDDGRALVRQLTADGFGVDVAFWGRHADDPWWYLYIASDQMDKHGPIEAYEKLQESQRKLAGTSVSLADVKLIKPSDPLAQHMRGLRDHYASPQTLRFQSVGTGTAGGLEEAYIYPTSVTFRTIVSGKEDVLRYLEERSRASAGTPGEYLIARDDAGELMAVIAGHSFVGSGTLSVGGKKLVLEEGLVTQVRDAG